MTSIPTPKDLHGLGQAIAQDGLAQYAADVEDIANLTQQSTLLPGAAAVLRDEDAPEVLRMRAFATIGRNWLDVLAALPAGLAFDRAFELFLADWSEHEQDRARESLSTLSTDRPTPAAPQPCR